MEAKKVKSDWLVIGRAITRGNIKKFSKSYKINLMKIKISGLNPTRDVQLCIDHNVDYLGFVFYDKSPKCEFNRYKNSF